MLLTKIFGHKVWLLAVFCRPICEQRHHIRKCLLLCMNFANCSVKTSHNRGQIYSNKVVSYCYFRGNLLLSGFSTKLAPFKWVTLDHILHENTARYKTEHYGAT